MFYAREIIKLTRFQTALQHIYFKYLKWRSRWRKTTILLLSSILVYAILWFIFPPPSIPHYSKCIYDRNGTLLNCYLTYDDKWRLYVSEDDISKELENTLLFKEDKWFYYHPGVNLFAIVRAAYHNIKEGKRTSGASTITMQVARMLEPKSRTVFHKLVEMYRATQLELLYSKKEILRLYLNLAPYGGNIEGIRSASLFYFNKAPDHLSISEFTALSIIPNRPESLKPSEDNSALLAARNEWLERFKEAELFPERIILEAIESPMNFRRTFRPGNAPHFSERMRIETYYPEVHTYLDQKVQNLLEERIRTQVSSLEAFGIHNGAGLIIDNRTMEVLGYVGSADFLDKSHDGQVDGVPAIRQPGSTLKPFIYARAMDMGLITPKRKVLDVPVNFKGYRPENFDRTFRGYVTVEDALAGSLNIPAVNMLNLIGIKQLTDLLIKADFKQIRMDASKLGLSTALGGCGVSLEELAGLYASLANGGLYSEMRWTEKDERGQDTIRLFSEASTYMIRQILQQTDRPDFPLNMNSNQPKIAWKTGTSYGRRDAWCVGISRNYTVAIWIGNFDGVGRPELTGANSAAPVVFNVFRILDPNCSNKDYEAPEQLSSRFVCQESGLPPNHLCKKEYPDDYIPFISDTRSCDIETEIFVSKDSSYAYCMECLPVVETPKMLIKKYPAALIGYMQARLIPFDESPPHNPNCTAISQQGELKIKNLGNGLEYTIEDNGKEMIALEADMPYDSETIYWWVNGAYAGQNVRGESRFVQLPAGTNTIECTDDKGRKDKITVVIRYF